MNKTQKDFEKAIAQTENQFIQYQNDFGWNYVKDAETQSNGRYHIVYFTNHMVSTTIKYNSQHGILDVASMSNVMINRLKELHTKLDGTQQ